MANIDFPPSAGLSVGYKYNDPVSGISYIWRGTYWDAQGADALVPKPYYEELIPVGAVLPFARTAIPDGWLSCNGSEISRAAYPDLFNILCVAPAFVAQTFTVTNAGVFTKNAHGFKGGERIRLFTTGSLFNGLSVGIDYFVIYLSDNTFSVSLNKYGSAIDPSGSSQSGTHTYLQSLFGLGDGINTFNLPDLRDEFIRGVGSISNLGAWQPDELKSHRHSIGYADGTVGGYATGNTPHAGSNWTGSTGGNETRPRNVALNYCIKAYKLVSNTDLIDVQALVAPIQIASDAAGWKLHSVSNIASGQSIVEFNPIPTTTKMIKITFNDVAFTTGNGYDVLMQIGVNTIYQNTVGSYIGSENIIFNTSTGKQTWKTKSGAIVYINNNGVQERMNGVIELTRQGNTNVWLVNGSIHDFGSDNIHMQTGKINGSDLLNKLRFIFDDGGSGNTGFSSGSIGMWLI